MKNKKRIFTLIAVLILFAGSEGFVVIKAQKENGTDQKGKNNNPKGSNEGNKTNRTQTTGGSRLKDTEPEGDLNNSNSLQRQNNEAGQIPPQHTLSTSDSKSIQGLEERVAKIEKRSTSETSWFPDWIPDWLKWAVTGLIGLAVLAGITAGTYLSRRNKQSERGEIAAGFNQLKKQQRTFADEIKQLTEVSKNLSQQLAQQKSEISSLKQQAQNAAYTAAPPSPPPMASAFQQPVEAPRFPVLVDDYLAKVKNGAVPVKYDYKERMLVEDGEGEGNLLVVRDDLISANLLFLVPSFGFFQTKSDYTNYFENYYTCARPTAGSVWIRQPATVKRINGGWQLARQGELEVR